MVYLKTLVLDDASLEGLICVLLFPKVLLTFKYFLLPKIVSMEDLLESYGDYTVY